MSNVTLEVLLKIIPALVFLICTGTLVSRLRESVDTREKLLWLAAMCVTLAFGAEFLLLFFDVVGFKGFLDALTFASFALACSGIVLALLGKGKGRIAITIACCGLVSWGPFVSPGMW
jgi:hypothetical protein